MTTIGTWDPDQQNDSTSDNSAHNEAINPASLTRLIDISASQQLENLNQVLSTEEATSYRHLMTHHKDNWLQAAATLTENDVIHFLLYDFVIELNTFGRYAHIHWVEKEQ